MRYKVVLPLLVACHSFSQTAQPTAPFLTTASITGRTSSSITLALRGANGKYFLFQTGPAQPYGVLGSVMAVMNLLSGFSVPPPQSSGVPTGVGLGSQGAAFSLDMDSVSAEVAVVPPGSNSSITVNRFDPSLADHSMTYQIGNYPAGVIAADFNGDGKIDLAVPFLGDGNSPGGVAILLKTGVGVFAPAVVYTAGFSPWSATAFDLNGDGILDLAVADSGSQTVGGGAWVLLGKGDGTFSKAVSYLAGSTALNIVAADFNGDGRPDLAVAAADNSISILLGKGGGAFSTGSSFKAASPINYLAAADFNGDGRMDLAAAAADGTISVFLGSGTGTFQFKSRYICGRDPDSLVITDYNGDGKLDIINATGDARGFGGSFNARNIDILLGNGDGTFQGGTIYPTGIDNGESAIGDFNGDGKPDIVTVGATVNTPTNIGASVLLGNGDGSFRPATLSNTVTSSGSVDVADFNRDSKLDIVTATDILLGNGDGTFRPSSSLPASGSFVRAGDFNGDGNPDVAIVASSGLTILLGKGDGTFQVGITYKLSSSPSGLAIADYNRDGKLDIAVVTGYFNDDPAGVFVFLGKGDGTFQAQLPAFTGAGPYFAIVAADFNGDGKPDLAIPYELNNTQNPPYVAILLGVGDGTFRAPINVPVADNGNPFGLAAGDFNSDGKVDLVIGGAEVLYLAGNGDGTFQDPIPFLGGPAPSKFAVGDLNRDGKLDLVITEGFTGGINTGTILPLLNSGPGSPLPSVTSTAPSFGSGNTQTFTITFSDPAGASNFQVVDVLINSALDGRHACYVAFQPSTNSVFLVDDAGDAGGPYQGLVLPGTGSISNSQCTLNGAGSSATISGNNLTLALSITFTPGFSGNQIVYTSAGDKAGGNSGWQALATWSVPGAAAAGPAVTGMSPARTSALGPTTYTFSFTDTNGAQDISIANILVSSAIDGRHACYLAFQPSTNSLFLVDDAGDAGGPYQGLVLPSSGSISNSQCTIGGGSVSASANSLTLTIPITFTQAFAGNQLFFLAARSNTQNSNWQAVGSISVP